MRSLIITTLFLSVISFNLFAQITEPIIVVKNGIKKTYLQNGEYLNHDQLLGVLKSKPESESECIMSEKQGMVFGVLPNTICKVLLIICLLYNLGNELATFIQIYRKISTRCSQLKLYNTEKMAKKV
jgi:hypothetical protein